MFENSSTPKVHSMHCRHLWMAIVSVLMLEMGGMASALGQGGSSCTSQPLAFRENIRQPDAWEEAWELIWPDASNALQMWRTQQFESLLEVWRTMGPHMVEAQRQAEARALPSSAAFLACFAHCPHPTTANVVTVPNAHVWEQLGRAQDPNEAMAFAHGHSESPLALDAWATEVRTGMRLMENLDLPPVHVVSQGETLYSIGRTWNVHPKCISEMNGVWDDIRPNMHILIPQPGH
jgi:hypothetical protein